MTGNLRALIWLVLVCCIIFFPASRLWADGGTVRLREQTGAYQITVFTAPMLFRAGPVDVSVLVLDAGTGERVPEARVSVRLTARGTGAVLEYPATAEAATNKLFHAAIFELPEPGWWDVEVAVDGPRGPALCRFDVQADEALPRWVELWPWFAWPALAVALFSLHRVLVRRRVAEVHAFRRAHKRAPALQDVIAFAGDALPESSPLAQAIGQDFRTLAEQVG